jgi:hypothetical protein
MEQVRVERLDHLGVIASVIKDLGLIAMIDTRLVPDGAPGVIGGKITVSCNHFIISNFRKTLWILKPPVSLRGLH